METGKNIIKGAVRLVNLVLRPTLLRLAMKEYESEVKVERTWCLGQLQMPACDAD